MATRSKPSSGKSSETGFDPAVFFATVAKGRAASAHGRKQIIFAQGEAADAVFYIRSGKVKMTVVSQHGKEAVVVILGKDEFMGEGCLIGQPKRLATAAAMTDCQVMSVEKSAILRLLEDEPAFAQMFIVHLLARNARVEEDLIDQLFNSTGWRACCCCWRISARRGVRSRSLRKSVRRRSPR